MHKNTVYLDYLCWLYLWKKYFHLLVQLLSQFLSNSRFFQLGWFSLRKKKLKNLAFDNFSPNMRFSNSFLCVWWNVKIGDYPHEEEGRFVTWAVLHELSDFLTWSKIVISLGIRWFPITCWVRLFSIWVLHACLGMTLREVSWLVVCAACCHMALVFAAMHLFNIF